MMSPGVEMHSLRQVDVRSIHGDAKVLNLALSACLNAA
jgi:hypothetical protein